MYINLESFDDLKKLEGGALESLKKNNCMIFIRMNGCYYCDKMKKEWQSLVKDKKNDDNLDILEIERNRLDDLMRRDREFFLPKFMGIRGFPTLMLQNRNREVFPFQDERNKVNFLRFIKVYSKPLIIKNVNKVAKTEKTTKKKTEKTKKKTEKTKKKTDKTKKTTEKKTEKKTEKTTEKKTKKKTEKTTEKKPKKKSNKGLDKKWKT